MLKKSMSSSKEIKTAHYELVTKTKLPRAPMQGAQVAKQVYVQESKGDIDYRTNDMKIWTEIAPGRPITCLKVGEKQYWLLAGYWYEAPSSFQLPAPVTQALSISQYLKYFKEIKKLPDAKIEDVSCFHIRAIPDMKTLAKLPGVTDLLKDPQGNQVRTVDELEEMKATFDFYIQKDNFYLKSSRQMIEYRAPEDLIRLGYAEPGDRVKAEQILTFSDFNKKLSLFPPKDVKPFPAEAVQQQ